ncbi:RIMS-binding protein 2 [Trichonephila clavata]|uniref:RIMS-binding protein 2 n=1 Tax=Trichonephila clavata TaxID=2740835 RepID=A0A8X6HR44_TRICU|nr:RIMS-binding protein 2 [Trichonephila clavata]
MSGEMCVIAAQKTSTIEISQYEALKKNNEALRQKLDELLKTSNELQDAEIRLQKKDFEVQQLKQELSDKQLLCADLEHRLLVTLEEGKKENNLEEQFQHSETATEECFQLLSSFDTFTSQSTLAKSDIERHQGKTNNLEALVKHMREAADKRKELEKQHADAVAELQRKQEEHRHHHYASKTEKQAAQEAIQNLESKVRELQKKCELQNVLHEELALEMAALRRSQVKHAWRSHRSHSADIPSETSSSKLDQEMDLYLVGSDTIFSSNRSHSVSSSLPVLETSTSRSLNVPFESFNSVPITSPGTNMISPGTTISSSSPVSSNILNSTSYEIDKIIARIEHDNRVLAELERSRATVGSPVTSHNMERLTAQFEDQKQEEITHRHNMKSSVTMKELDVLMAKLEQDNKILAELDRKRANISNRRPISATPPGSRSSTPLTGTASLSGMPIGNVTQQSHYSSTLPSLPPSTPYASTPGVTTNKSEDMYGEIDFIDLPHRGRCKVYIARYSYDPIKQSPNENPEAELKLMAGDYVLIFGDMDEDGFFNGELLDGRKGLVPSNFVEKLTGEELYEFQSQVLYGTRDSDDGTSSLIFHDGDLAGDDPQLFCRVESKITTEDFHRMNDYIDLEDLDEFEDDYLTDLERDEVPPPTRLVLERQLNKSILIGWCPPDAPRGTAEAYHVYVDGVPKATIRATEKTRALVEGVDCNQPHRISVRSVNPSGRHSRDAACTIVIGKDVPLAPSCVKALNVTSTSAVIVWLPSNSNFQHVVAINSVEVKTLKPGIFRHPISGLAPNTTYRVSVRARPARLFFNHENPKKIGLLTSAIEFKTLPKGCKGLPEPPLDVQIEPGPQDGTLLVTWLPVTINNRGTSNGAPVTGYAVYTGDRKVSEVDSPTGDHALLDMMNLAPLKKRAVTVKTKSGDNLSIDSMPCLIPVELLKGVAATLLHQGETDTTANAEEGEKEHRPQRRRSTGSSDSESDTELAELLKHVARRTAEFDPAAAAEISSGQQGARVEDLVEEGIRSELSDIAEEPEEDMMHPDRKDRKGQHSRDNKSPRDSRSPREYDRRDRSDHRDDRHDRRDKRYEDDRRRDDRRDERRDDRRDRIDDRRDREYRDDRYDDRMEDRSRREDRLDKRDGRIDDRRDRYGPRDGRDSDLPRTKHSQPHSDSRSHERHHGRSSPTSVHRDSRGRSYNSRSSDPRRINNLEVERRNSAGQVIIEPEENLSDKEIYPQSQHVIPAIEITRDSELGSHDEYMRSGRRGQYPDSHKNPSQYYPSDHGRSHEATTPVNRYPRGEENSYYGHRGHSRSSRDNYHSGGGGEYHNRSSYRGGTEKSRMFMAVYDYDPLTMSPNPATAHEELSFHEGQIIKVYGEKDSDGLFYGEINGRVGYVPYKMVTEIPLDEEETARHLMNEGVPPRHHHSGGPGDPWSAYPVKKLVALYDYDPQELSPNVDAEMELAFRTGDVIYVYGEADEDGFYMGELNGERGLVPSNFLTEAPPDFRDPRLAPSGRSGGSYPKEPRDSAQYPRGSGGQHYPSSRSSKEHMPSEKTRYSERPSTERSSYDRGSGHTSERDRGQYNSSGRSGQHW